MRQSQLTGLLIRSKAAKHPTVLPASTNFECRGISMLLLVRINSYVRDAVYSVLASLISLRVPAAMMPFICTAVVFPLQPVEDCCDFPQQGIDLLRDTLASTRLHLAIR